MAKRCELTGKDSQSGNNVSHSHRKTRRKFLPNLQTISLKSDALNKVFSLKIAASTLRTINKYGNLDNYLVNTKNTYLTELAIKIKRKVKPALEAKKSA